MRPLVLFIFRLIPGLFALLFFYPVAFIFIIVLKTLWNFNPRENYKIWLELIHSRFEEQSHYEYYDKPHYYYYRNVWTYIIGKKEYAENPDYKKNRKTRKKKPSAEDVKTVVRAALDSV